MSKINEIFLSLFEERNETNRELYLDWRMEQADYDWTLSKIITRIINSWQFFFLPWCERKQITAKVVEAFFKEDQRYRQLLYIDRKTHSVRLRGWRLKPV